jgi:ABC-type transport system substrate-binding protein
VQIVQENLKKIGIPVELKAVDGGTWSGALSDGSFDMILFSTNANSPDLIDAPAYVAGTKMLYSQMDAAKLGQLITSYKATGDTKQKVGIVQQIDDYLTDEAPYLVLSDCKVIDARQTNIKGLNVQPWSTYYYDTLSR